MMVLQPFWFLIFAAKCCNLNWSTMFRHLMLFFYVGNKLNNSLACSYLEAVLSQLTWGKNHNHNKQYKKIHKYLPRPLLLWSFFLLISGDEKKSLAVFLLLLLLFLGLLLFILLELLLFILMVTLSSFFCCLSLSLFALTSIGSICSGIFFSFSTKFGLLLLELLKISLESKLLDFPKFFSWWFILELGRCRSRLWRLLLASLWLLTRINLEWNILM